MSKSLINLCHRQKSGLTATRPNQEKYFYSALLKHRDEQLETYLQHSPSGVSYSASDYHHSKAASQHARMPEESPTRAAKVQRTQSGFSIKNAEHLTSRHSFYDVPASERSYDPFRASRDPIINPRSNYLNVTVHRRGNSNGSRRLPSGAPLPSAPTRSLRVENLRKNDSVRSSKRLSRLSNTSSSLRSSQRLYVPGRKSSRSSSRISVNSSQWLSSPPIASMRPSDLHKRGVQFPHLRKSSTTSALTAQAEAERPSRSPDGGGKAPILTHATRASPLASSPTVQLHNVVRSRKENATTVAPTPRTRKMRDIDQEARKVSTELGKACEEAFFRSSISSSARSSVIEKRDPYLDTPPSSVHNRFPYPKQKPFLDRATLANRPLPPTPIETTSSFQTAETPNTYTARELTEMRERLAVKYQQGGTSNQKYFNDVLRQLDSLMPPSSRHHQMGDGKRVVSAPQQNSSFSYAEEMSQLQVIPEEGRFADADVDFTRSEKPGRGQRSATEPSKNHVYFGNKNLSETIRLVPASSPPPSPSPLPWAPLIIRKQSNNSSLSENQRSRKISDANTGMNLILGSDTLLLPCIHSSYSGIVAEGDQPTDNAVLPRSRTGTPVTPKQPSSHSRMASPSSSTLDTRGSDEIQAVVDSVNVSGLSNKAAGKSFFGLDERTSRRDYRAASVTAVMKTETDETIAPSKTRGIFRRLFKRKYVHDPTTVLTGMLVSITIQLPWTN
jgi:serine/threonine-protein kinase HSL1 (negative regulator of Swe1 kinase)